MGEVGAALARTIRPSWAPAGAPDWVTTWALRDVLPETVWYT